MANKAVEMTQDNTVIGTPARQERDRLQKLTEGVSSGPTTESPEELNATPVVKTRL